MAEREPVRITGVHALSAFGRGTEALLAGMLAGTPAFAPVRRFDTSGRRVTVAATLPEVGTLSDELTDAVDAACRAAGLDRAQRSVSALLLAVHGGPEVPALAGHLARRCGLGGRTGVYTAACVSASTAVADAASLIGRGDLDRVVVAAGYLVEPEQYALFDAGRALATDGAVRPFSAGRQGLLLGDGVAAVVLESAQAAARRGATPLATVAGWGRAGDAYHPCQPDPQGRGLARAVTAALRRAGLPAEAVGYVNANATGTPHSDASEAAALRRAVGDRAERIPVSSTKSVHGHALEASGLLELVVTVLALRHGKLPVNAGWLGPDETCELDIITNAPRPAATEYALTLNAAFGGANTALVVGPPTTLPPRSCTSGGGKWGECLVLPTQTARSGEWERGEWGAGRPPGVPGFVYSDFPPLVAAVADRCLARRHGTPPVPAGHRTGVVLVSASGDRASAEHVRATVAAAGRIGPLFFFQAVPNSIAGHVAARWGLDGPVVCLSPTGEPRADGTAEAELLLHDGDADEVLLVLVEQAPDGTPGEATAVLLGGGTRR